MTEAKWLADVRRRLDDAANGPFGRTDGKRLLRLLLATMAERDQLIAMRRATGATGATQEGGRDG